jgi:cytoskeletal protein RodZ
MAPTTAIVIRAFMSSTRWRARSKPRRATAAPPTRIAGRYSAIDHGGETNPTAQPPRASASAVRVAREEDGAGAAASRTGKPAAANAPSTTPGASVWTTTVSPVTADARTEQTPGETAQAVLDQRDLGRAVEARHHERLAPLVLAARTGGGRHRRRRPRASSAA